MTLSPIAAYIFMTTPQSRSKGTLSWYVCRSFQELSSFTNKKVVNDKSPRLGFWCLHLCWPMHTNNYHDAEIIWRSQNRTHNSNCYHSTFLIPGWACRRQLFISLFVLFIPGQAHQLNFHGDNPETQKLYKTRRSFENFSFELSSRTTFVTLGASVKLDQRCQCHIQCFRFFVYGSSCDRCSALCPGIMRPPCSDANVA